MTEPIEKQREELKTRVADQVARLKNGVADARQILSTIEEDRLRYPFAAQHIREDLFLVQRELRSSTTLLRRIPDLSDFEVSLILGIYRKHDNRGQP